MGLDPFYTAYRAERCCFCNQVGKELIAEERKWSRMLCV